MLARLQGRADEDAFDWEPARLALPLPPCDVRETFHRAVLRGGEATPADFQESHAQRALGQSNALIRQSANSAAIPADETVQALRF
jgi:molybdopterin biosynthesis enzyme